MCNIEASIIPIGRNSITLFKVKSKDELLFNDIVSNLFKKDLIDYWFKNEIEMYKYFDYINDEIIDKQIILIY